MHQSRSLSRPGTGFGHLEVTQGEIVEGSPYCCSGACTVSCRRGGAGPANEAESGSSNPESLGRPGIHGLRGTAMGTHQGSHL